MRPGISEQTMSSKKLNKTRKSDFFCFWHPGTTMRRSLDSTMNWGLLGTASQRPMWSRLPACLSYATLRSPDIWNYWTKTDNLSILKLFCCKSSAKHCAVLLKQQRVSPCYLWTVVTQSARYCKSSHKNYWTKSVFRFLTVWIQQICKYLQIQRWLPTESVVNSRHLTASEYY